MKFVVVSFYANECSTSNSYKSQDRFSSEIRLEHKPIGSSSPNRSQRGTLTLVLQKQHPLSITSSNN